MDIATQPNHIPDSGAGIFMLTHSPVSRTLPSLRLALCSSSIAHAPTGSADVAHATA